MDQLNPKVLLILFINDVDDIHNLPYRIYIQHSFLDSL